MALKTEFINNSRTVNVLPDYKLASLDVYTNIPVKATKKSLRDNLTVNNTLNSQAIYELTNLLETVLQQYYVTFSNQIFIQDVGLTIGQPLSSLLVGNSINFLKILIYY